MGQIRSCHQDGPGDIFPIIYWMHISLLFCAHKDVIAWPPYGPAGPWPWVFGTGSGTGRISVRRDEPWSVPRPRERRGSVKRQWR